mgnify:CR=1 FL=1
MEQTYLYSVRPRKPIKDLEGISFIRTPRTLQLTKDDVIKCLNNAASIYRYFANEGKQIRVTIDTVDRLHNEKFMEEDDYKAFLAGELGKNSGKVIEAVVEDTKTEEKIEESKEVIVEENPAKVTEEIETELTTETDAESANEDKEDTEKESTDKNNDDQEEKVEVVENHNNTKSNKNGHHKKR